MVRKNAVRTSSGQAASLIVVMIGFLAVLLLLALAFLGIYISGRNRVVRLDETANQAWADVDAQLQRRFDLIPNLVATVQGYAAHEKEIFEYVAQARTKYFQSDNINDKIAASNELTGLVSRLLLLQEQYPQLKANQNFLSLQDQLEGTENRIAVARTRYNEAAGALNRYIRAFPGSLYANWAGVKQKPYFETSPAARTAPPQVDFSPKPTAPTLPPPQ